MPSVQRIVLLAGEPFCGALFDGVKARLRELLPGHPVVVARSGDAVGDLNGAVVVAHGLAVPIAVGLAQATPPLSLVLSNGPVSRLDPASASVARLAATPVLGTVLSRVALRPAPWLLALRSSVALRRLVNNPYAMDRDTVAAICGPVVASVAGRQQVVAQLAALQRVTFPLVLPACPVVALWGDNDRLYPAHEMDLLSSMRQDVEVLVVPGGRFLHVFEQPWSFADHVVGVVQRTEAGESFGADRPGPVAATADLGRTTAPMSRTEGPRIPGGRRSSVSASVVRS